MTHDVNRYPVHVFPSEDDEGFIAMVRDLPGCSAYGGTDLEALVEIKNAIAAWIDAATAAGNTVPAPSRPALEPRVSGKFLIRMPRDLHADLEQKAERQGTSLNQYIVYLLTKGVTSELVAEAVSTYALTIQCSAAGAQSASTRSRIEFARQMQTKPALTASSAGGPSVLTFRGTQ